MGLEELLSSVFEAVLQRYITILLSGMVLQVVATVLLFALGWGALCFWMGLQLRD